MKTTTAFSVSVFFLSIGLVGAAVQETQPAARNAVGTQETRRDETVSSLKLYSGYRGTGFAMHSFYPLGRPHRTPAGDVLVAVTTDEDNPAATYPFPGTRPWYYAGSKVTQYWKKPRGAFHNDLHAAVNARYTYWQSSQPIPGGIAFENFELREKFHEGQRFIFGITRQTPQQLGMTAK